MARGTPSRSRNRGRTASAISTGVFAAMSARSISCKIWRRSVDVASAAATRRSFRSATPPIPASVAVKANATAAATMTSVCIRCRTALLERWATTPHPSDRGVRYAVQPTAPSSRSRVSWVRGGRLVHLRDVRLTAPAHPLIPVAVGEAPSVDFRHLRVRSPEHPGRVRQERLADPREGLGDLPEVAECFGSVSPLDPLAEAEAPGVGQEQVPVPSLTRLDEIRDRARERLVGGERGVRLEQNRPTVESARDQQDQHEDRKNGRDRPPSPPSEPPPGGVGLIDHEPSRGRPGWLPFTHDWVVGSSHTCGVLYRHPPSHESNMPKRPRRRKWTPCLRSVRNSSRDDREPSSAPATTPAHLVLRCLHL